MYLEVARLHNGRNNGSLALSVRDGAERCNINKDTAGRALHALEARGLIVCMTKGGFSRKTPHAAEWRLTDWPSAESNELNSEAGMKYRVLSLDGGGVWALIQVRTLIALFGANTSGHEVLQSFDLVAGTSGGSIVLGGLVEGVTLGDLLNFFEDETKRSAIFSQTHMSVDRLLYDATGIGPKYSAEAKLPALERLMPDQGAKPLSTVTAGIRRQGAEVDVHLLITAFDYDRNCARFFRSAPAGRQGWGTGAASDVTLAEAIHASTNAPVIFFDEPAEFNGGRYWDGAITGCNNPILAAVTEAIVLGADPRSIAALTIGAATTSLLGPPVSDPPSPIQQVRPNQSLANDLAKIAAAVTYEPPEIATFLAHAMTGGGDDVPAPAQSRIVRMNPLIGPVRTATGGWQIPDFMSAAQFKYFCNIEMDALDPNQVTYISEFAEYWLQDRTRNQPIRMNGDTLAVEIGYEKYSAAAAAWAAIR
jgi:hypothetical protein